MIFNQGIYVESCSMKMAVNHEKHLENIACIILIILFKTFFQDIFH